MTILRKTISAEVQHKEEQHFFELREQLKESIRKKMRKESGFLWNISQKNKKLPSDNYGAFFGQSQPSIAWRVIKESKILLEAKKPAADFKDLSASKADVAVRREKAQKLRVSRDYSFIFSDDYESLTSLSSTMGKATRQRPISYVQGAMSNSLQKKHLDEGKKKYEPKKSKQVKSVEKLISEEKIKVIEHNKAKVIQNKLKCSSKSQTFDVDKTKQKKELNEPNRLESSSQNKDLNGSSKPSLIIRLKIPSRLKMAKEMEVCNPKNEESIPSQKKFYKMHEQKKELEDSLCSNTEVKKGYISCVCESLFRPNHKKRARDDYEEDGECKVASFADIQREERQSAKIARREDRIEQLRNEHEEKKERLRRQTKKHKLTP
ncbi:uncharacterized protein LOC123213178 [Mangifera indica]|uniref:uncharacterized protein LOC123213178 n=1 Tax=Mangifera indica TaxID=29780 RepID=UPI001CF9D6C2|nr:uncharacterized protein LOC123213178 [Mangifera indica]